MKDLRTLVYSLHCWDIKKIGREVKVGDVLTDLCDEQSVLVRIERPKRLGDCGMVYVRPVGDPEAPERPFQPYVFNLEWAGVVCLGGSRDFE